MYTSPFIWKTKNERFTVAPSNLMLNWKQTLKRCSFTTEFKQKPPQQQKRPLKIKIWANVPILRFFLTRILYCSQCTLEINELTAVFVFFCFFFPTSSFESYIWKLQVVIWQATSKTLPKSVLHVARAARLFVFHSTNQWTLFSGVVVADCLYHFLKFFIICLRQLNIATGKIYS